MTKQERISRRYSDLTIQQLIIISCRLEDMIRANKRALSDLSKLLSYDSGVAMDVIHINIENQLALTERQLGEVDMAIESREGNFRYNECKNLDRFVEGLRAKRGGAK